MSVSTWRDLYNKTAVPELSPPERDKIFILTVEPDNSVRMQLRQTLITIGFTHVYDAPNHAMALTKLQERKITHVIFDAKKTNMPVREFLLKVSEFDDKIITLPSSQEPSVDDVFGLLTLGARGYIVKPFNSQSLDDAICMATKGEPISEAILFAKNRNEALASLVLTAQGKVANLMRQAQNFETARRELPKKLTAFRRAMDIAKIFAEGGEAKFAEALVEFAIERGSGPAGRLGKIRKRLDAKKAERARKNASEEVEKPIEEPPPMETEAE